MISVGSLETISYAHTYYAPDAPQREFRWRCRSGCCKGLPGVCGKNRRCACHYGDWDD